MRDPKSKIRDGVLLSRVGFNTKSAATGGFTQSGGLPNLNDPNLKAAAFHKDGAWVVVPGPASSLYGRHLRLPGSVSSFASTPDTAANSITGDLDIRVKATLDLWSGAATEGVLVGKWDVNPGQRAFSLNVTETGRIQFRFSRDGAEQIIVAGDVLGFANASVQWVRVTRVASTGTVTFFKSTDGVTWTQVGGTQAPAAGDLFNSTLQLGVGGIGNSFILTGKIFYAEVRNGVSGPVTVKFDPQNDTSDSAASFKSSSTGEVWTVNSTASLRSDVAVVNSAANGFESSPFWPDATGPMMAAKISVGGTAPYISAVDAQALLGSTFWSSNHAVYVVAKTDLTGAVEGLFWSHGTNGGSGCYVYRRNNGTFNVAYHNGTRQDLYATQPDPSRKWVVGCATRNGPNYALRSGGVTESQAVTVTASNPINDPLVFGALNAASGAPLGGTLALLLFYAEGHDGAKMVSVESQIFGTYAITPSGLTPITTTRSGAIRDISSVEPENLIKYSEELDNAAHAKTSCTVTANSATGPSGRMTADLVVATDPNYPFIISNSGYVGGGEMTARAKFRLPSGSAPRTVGFRLWNVTDSTTIAYATGTVTADAWVTLTATGTVPVGKSAGTVVYVNDGGGTPISVGTGTLITEVQLNKGSTANPYVRTFADARPAGPFLYAAADNARLVHPTKGLPCFAAVTNWCLQSEDFANASWSGTAVITANSTLALDRTQTADTLNDNSATEQLLKSQTFAVANDAVARTASVFVKKTSGNTHYAAITLTYTAGATALDYRLIVNTNTGAVASTLGSPARAVVTDAGDYWRFELTGANNTTGNTTATIYVVPAFNATGGTVGDIATQGSNVFWGVQFEIGSSAGPYIPTTTASASSTADTLSLPTTGWPQGAFEVELDYTPGKSPMGDEYLLDTRQSGGAGAAILLSNATTKALQFYLSNGVSGGDATSGVLTWTAGTTYRIKARLLANGAVSIYRDGVLLGSNTSTVTTFSHGPTAYIGRFYGSSTQHANGHLRLLYVGKPR